MDATAIIYEFKKEKRKNKEKIRRNIFGYKDGSNKGQYSYERQGILSPLIKEKWGKSVIIIGRKDERKTFRVLNKNNVEHRKVRIKIQD